MSAALRVLRNALDSALGYGVKSCEDCGLAFSARGSWFPGQTVPTGPYSARLAYCRYCRRGKHETTHGALGATR